MSQIALELLRKLGSLHQAHHDFFDRRLEWHEEAVVPNLLLHVVPEYATQMAVCALAFSVLQPLAVLTVMAIFTTIFIFVLLVQGKDRYHLLHPILPAAHETIVVGPNYHALHHIYPENYLSSYITLLDRFFGTACQIKGRRIAITGASGSFGAPFAALLEKAGAEVFPLKFGVDYTYDDYSRTDPILTQTDILVLAHGAKGEHAMQANCESFLALIDRFQSLTRHRQVAVEVWAVGSEIECHPAFGIPELQSYARSKRSYARAAAAFVRDPDLLYRHIVPSAFTSPMGPGLISGKIAASIAFWLIRHGFRYVPVTYTGIAFLNFIPFFIRACRTRPGPSQAHCHRTIAHRAGNSTQEPPPQLGRFVNPKRWLIPVWNESHRLGWIARENLGALASGRLEHCTVCGHFRPMRFRRRIIPRRLRELWGLTPELANALIRKESCDCFTCGAKLRCRRLASVLLELYPVGDPQTKARSLAAWIQHPEIQAFHIAEINHIDGIHGILAKLPHFASSDFTPGSAPGALVDGTRSEDLTQLTYADRSFDIVLTSESLEHVPNLSAARAEIKRILVPGGRHIFTIPMLPGVPKTFARAIIGPDGTFETKAPPISHPGGDWGYPVFTEFGADFPDLLREAGFIVDVRFGPVSNQDLAQVYVCQI